MNLKVWFPEKKFKLQEEKSLKDQLVKCILKELKEKKKQFMTLKLEEKSNSKLNSQKELENH